ncbi:MAG: DUF1385 domain-containing protein [Oscillospiraceae bacterium]|nr:DUF1385 domain-containing protein [Oscillospiraceae bacterium]
MANQENQENQAQCAFRTTIGGQALIEGIYMRGPEKQSVVVRNQEGELVVKTTELRFTKERYPILGIPFIRGAFAFIGTMIEGVKALMYSAEFYPEEELGEPTKLDKWLEAHLSDEKLEKVLVAVSTVLAVAFSVGLFFLLPTLAAGALNYFVPLGVLGRNLVEGIIRVVIFMVYLILISRMKDIRRVFSYHGAEHKTIFCYERGLELTVENVRSLPRHHPRCGTSFLVVVIILAILCYSILFSFVTPPNTLIRMLLQLLLIPVIVGIAYELNRYVGRHDNLFTKIATAPGLWMQNFTTFEPDDSMIEVGIASLQQVLPQVQGADEW